jgi:hypothetical protein
MTVHQGDLLSDHGCHRDGLFGIAGVVLDAEDNLSAVHATAALMSLAASAAPRRAWLIAGPAAGRSLSRQQRSGYPARTQSEEKNNAEINNA